MKILKKLPTLICMNLFILIVFFFFVFFFWPSLGKGKHFAYGPHVFVRWVNASNVFTWAKILYANLNMNIVYPTYQATKKRNPGRLRSIHPISNTKFTLVKSTATESNPL